ncbi:MAG: 30S ribosome-binding factor RbfA [Ignavibacteriae bacterium]|nr:30S ribosome-binding factor RbfA [Ignavibacteriota bacterium]MCB9206812.1 30S ribosome-binding factor RbfA [Ignavibacteriales bacterium]MCB9210180.1 30S ribosome-binding factor RbfA [Ignavibacteriales bacterium]MCB9218435.1 30S ribosome-binding factor RbfA [Ignavibacteriales bacterium]MCB9259559.1 30S ribosome-binding factor RbfA [Ignavibacteriales bacterium]
MSVRQEKISSLIQETLSNIFLQKVLDPELGLVTITKTKVTPDLKIAKVYLSVYEKDKRSYVLEHIESIKGFIRSELAKKVNLRYTPELQFYIDDTMDYVEKMNEIFNNLKDDSNKENEAN